MQVTYFIDDSGRDDPPVFVLAGLAVRSDKVEALEADWTAVLTAPPQLAAFKMKDAHGLRGAFAGWDWKDRDKKLLALAGVIERHAQVVLSLSVLHENYDAVFRGRMMRSMDHPYETMFHLLIVQAFLQRGRLEPASQAAFVFDRQRGAETSLAQIFDNFDAALVPEIQAFLSQPPRHADDVVEVALQAADMIAWHVRRSATQTGGLASASVAGPILARMTGDHIELSRDRLLAVSRSINATIGGLHTVLPYDRERINAAFPAMATFANLSLIRDAVPFTITELVSFPAIGTARFRLVHSCERLHSPHLHRRRENACLEGP